MAKKWEFFWIFFLEFWFQDSGFLGILSQVILKYFGGFLGAKNSKKCQKNAIKFFFSPGLFVPKFRIFGNSVPRNFKIFLVFFVVKKRAKNEIFWGGIFPGVLVAKFRIFWNFYPKGFKNICGFFWVEKTTKTWQKTEIF